MLKVCESVGFSAVILRDNFDKGLVIERLILTLFSAGLRVPDQSLTDSRLRVSSLQSCHSEPGLLLLEYKIYSVIKSKTNLIIICLIPYHHSQKNSQNVVYFLVSLILSLDILVSRTTIAAR